MPRLTLLTLCFLLGLAASPAVAPVTAQPLPAAAGSASAEASLAHLRRVMDQFHTRFPVYDDVSSAGNHFHAWAKIPGEEAAVVMNGSATERVHSGATAIRAEFTDAPGPNFGGFYLLNGVLPSGALEPALNFGTVPRAGLDLRGATKLTFWAAGARGGERITFFLGGVGRDPDSGAPTSPFPDSTPVVRRTVVLTRGWQRYDISLAGKNLQYVLGGFGWAASDVDNPGGAVFYVDDIQYELSAAARNSRLAQPRFLRSFETAPFQMLPSPVGDFDLVNRNVADTYDNALALLAFLASGRPEDLRRARLLGDAFVYASRNDRIYNDGRLRDAYMAGDIALPPGWTPNDREGTVPVPGYYTEDRDFIEIEQVGISTGNNAWAMLALLALHERTREPRYLATARRIGRFVLQFQATSGTYRGFRGGLDDPEGQAVQRLWASTEHNLDLVAAFSLFARRDPAGGWQGAANHAAAFVAAMWDAGRRCNLAGTLDPERRNQEPGQLPSDVQSWAVLAAASPAARQGALVRCAERFHRLEEAGRRGFDFNEDRDGLWFEGTAHMAVAYALLRQTAATQAARGVLAKAQASPPTGDGRGLAAASHDGLTTGFGFFFHRRLHVGATAWNVFAQLGWNPFSGRAVGSR